MKIAVRYFASIREALGPGENISVAEGASVGSLRDLLIGRGAPHAAALGRGRALRCALNQSICDEATPLHDGAEVAFFPPVTGG
jgi:molybdopterin synthase sulfur carrier subunit